MKKSTVRWLALLLVAAMALGMLPLVAMAKNSEEGPGVSDYATFVENLKVLEVYADAYAATSGKDAGELLVNFIRTGVERYNDDNWVTLAGEEITGFTSFVEAQDAANGTTAMLLRNIYIDDFTLPNGNPVDFGHMFGTMNISYVSSAVPSADLAGWAGDLCDLVLYSKEYGSVPAGTVDEMAAYILENCFGIDADDAFGMDDFYGDLDAYYLIQEWKGSNTKLSTIMEAYFTPELSDGDRSAYLMNNRFSGLKTQADVRTAVYNAYSGNIGVQVLEAGRGLSEDTELRTACCYAFADYLYQQGGDQLESGSGDSGEAEENPYYTVFSETDSVLAPGISQSIKYAMTADKKQIAYYVATVDVTRDDVTIMANYKDNDPSKGWGMQRVVDQAAALMAKHTDPDDAENYIENFNVIVATNGDGYNMSTGQPGGLLVMEGVEWHGVDKDGFFAILKDGSAMIGTQAEYATYKDQIQEAIGGFGSVLIRDGEIVVSEGSDYTSSRASRTAIGITADGKVVMMVLDGRQEPFSAGGAMIEIAQIMKDAGCVNAVNLDGGGSTTYASKAEGSDSLTLVNRPSDGYARSVSTSLVAVSTAKSSTEFDHANVSAEYDYLTVGTSVAVSAVGVSNTGNAAAIPEDAVWQVSDSAIGSVSADGVFTAAANGTVDVQLVLEGEVLGSKTLNVVIPDSIAFAKESMNVIFGVPTEMPVELYYNGNIVAFNRNDVELALTDADAGFIDGLTFTANEEVGLRTVYIAALLMPYAESYALMNLNMYKDGEAVFDFDDVTAGNRTLAWKRTVSNATTVDQLVYRVDDPSQPMEISYVFGLDMREIGIPEQLADLTYMLPGADAGATAWEFLLQLAERVSVLTEVTIVAQLDKDLDVDISEISIHNEYFELRKAELDEETNTLTVVAGWIDQTAAIDPISANPVCILSGVKAVPKDGAELNAENQMAVVSDGNVNYCIYLRASSLYSFACIEENQKVYGLQPYSSSELEYNGGPEKGAYFGSSYATFEDSFTLDYSLTQGWVEEDGQMFYYVDNLPVTGIQLVPSYEDPAVKLYYEFNEDGVCLGTAVGLIELNGNLYYAMLGEQKLGWQSVMDASGESFFYYFDPNNGGAAVNGTCKVEGYTYVFEDYKCVKGQLVENATGLRYRFAGAWQRNQWIEVDGKLYYFERDYYALTDGYYWIRSYDGTFEGYHLFDENGVWLRDYSGIVHVGSDSYLVENGIRLTEPGLVLIDGYYYYFCSTGKAVKNCTYWPTKTNGLLPMAAYKFDEQGRMINPPVTEPDAPDSGEPETPETPEIPETPAVKNGIVEENGALYYYIDGVRAYSAGLIEIEAGVYIYVRSNAQLATGSYWPTNTNGLLSQGMYNFGDDGRLVIKTEEEPSEPETEPTEPSQPEEEPTTPSEPEEEPTVPTQPAVKNGIVEENGVLYYYINGIRGYAAGLIEIEDGVYIYVRSNGQLAIGNYWPTNTNGLLNQGLYNFGTDGRLVIKTEEEPSEPEEEPTEPSKPEEEPTVPSEPEEEPTTPTQPAVKNGIVEENGVLYYYINGIRGYAAGLLQFEDENGDTYYIYVRSNGQLATGVYWPTNHNGLLPYKAYNFGDNGRLYL